MIHRLFEVGFQFLDHFALKQHGVIYKGKFLFQNRKQVLKMAGLDLGAKLSLLFAGRTLFFPLLLTFGPQG